MNFRRLKDLLHNEKSYRYGQVINAYCRGDIQSWEQISTLPKALKDKLKSSLSWNEFIIANKILGSRTLKLLLQTKDKLYVEAVLIKGTKWNTFCISSQIGCAVGCKFCATGRLGLKRNLTVWEILDQVVLLKHFMNKEKRFNIVFMGMGEPLFNADNVLESIKYLTSHKYFGLSVRRITISTVAPIKQLRQFLRQNKYIPKYAISLHAANQAAREKLIPIALYNNIDDIAKIMKKWAVENNKRVYFEYVLIPNVNMNDSDAYSLKKLFEGFSKKLYMVNFIPLNPVDSTFMPPVQKDITRFTNLCAKLKIPFTVRKSNGEEIKAACGQLAGSGKPVKRIVFDKDESI